MGAMASQITSLTSFYSTVHSGADQRKHQSTDDRWIPRTNGQYRGKWQCHFHGFRDEYWSCNMLIRVNPKTLRVFNCIITFLIFTYLPQTSLLLFIKNDLLSLSIAMLKHFEYPVIHKAKRFSIDNQQWWIDVVNNQFYDRHSILQCRIQKNLYWDNSYVTYNIGANWAYYLAVYRHAVGL